MNNLRGLLACLFCLLSSNSIAQERHIGFVLDLVGHWSINGASISKGQAVPPGGMIQFSGPPGERSQSNVTIILLNNRSVYLSCSAPKTCDKPVELPKYLLETPPLMHRLTDAAFAIFARKPDKYVPALVRSGNQNYLAEAVISRSGGQVLLNPALSSVWTGRYRLQVFNLKRYNSDARAVATIELDWNADIPPDVKSNQIAEGLYELSLIPVDKAWEAAQPSTAWVLIVAAEKYPQIASEFSLVLSGLAQWDNAIAVHVRRTFLRACLESLGGGSK